MRVRACTWFAATARRNGGTNPPAQGASTVSTNSINSRIVTNTTQDRLASNQAGEISGALFMEWF